MSSRSHGHDRAPHGSTGVGSAGVLWFSLVANVGLLVVQIIGAAAFLPLALRADGRGQAAALALRNIEMLVMSIQGKNTMKPRKDTSWGITRMRAVV